MMTDEEASELLRNNDWAKFSDARELLQKAAHMGAMAERERCAKLPALPKPRMLASGTIVGKRIELKGWYTDDIEIWSVQHGLKFGPNG